MPLARHDWRYRRSNCPGDNFYSHASCEAWHDASEISVQQVNFYSHASCEAWPNICRAYITLSQFLLTCLLRGMTCRELWSEPRLNISTHMPLARHDDQKHSNQKKQEISTHMPLARHDRMELFHFSLIPLISTHMPLARHDESHHIRQTPDHDFYSHASCEAWQDSLPLWM